MPIFVSLRTWLEHCDQGHECRSGLAHDEYKEQKWPSRLLNVTPSNNPNEIRLDIQGKAKPERYAALSYCWGQTPEDKSPPWRTLRGNLDERRTAFMLYDLPQTLIDAVVATRELGIQYLWIDSLCIIQDGDDWKEESKRMEAVFASAYCTIAATAATDSQSGFLKKEMTNSAFVQTGTRSRVNALKVSADFDHDINQAPLNKRAWVMQERYLSPRTIHFGNRVYGECGEGVYAGGDLLLKCDRGSNKYYQLDARFPDRLRTSGFDSTRKFLQSLIEDYSGRGITNKTDRPIAIAGLMSRIAKALPSEIHHGIVDWCLHRALLWRRVDGQRSRKIEYEHEQFVPSWSWMAYEGGISFIGNDCAWGDMDIIKNIKFGTYALEAAVWRFADSESRITRDGSVGPQLLDSTGSKKGWVSFDGEANSWSPPEVVVLARLREKQADAGRYFVLFVEQQKPEQYERRGVGMIMECCELELIGKHCRIV